jgi:hypothetical protein
MNKISTLGFGMAIGLTWFLIILFVGMFAMMILRGGWDPNIFNSVLIFKSLFNLAYPGWTSSFFATFLSALWGFVHGFIAGYFIALFYNVFCKLFVK